MLLLGAVGLFAVSNQAWAETRWERSLGVGTQAASGINRLGSPSSFTRIRPYIDLGVTGRVSIGDPLVSPPASEFAIQARARGWLDPYNGSPKTPAEFYPVEGAFSLRSGWFLGKVGLQQAAWGHSFGVFIADLVNPRDLRDPLFNELSWTRIAQGALDLQYVSDGLTVQLLYTPFPFDPILPLTTGPFYEHQYNSTYANLPRKDYEDWNWNRFWEFGEAGGKVGYRFAVGLDLAVFGLTHYARSPAYVVQSAPEVTGGQALRPMRVRTESFGLLVKQNFGEGWAAWADVVGHVDQASNRVAPLGGAPLVFNQIQAIVGLEWQMEMGLKIGTQYHVENRDRENARHWAGLRGSWSFFDGKLVPSAFALVGAGNGDLWLQPQIHWLPDEHWDISVRGDLAGGINGLDQGYFPSGTDWSRVMLWLDWKI